MKANCLNQPLSLVLFFIMLTFSGFAEKKWENVDKTIQESFTMNNDATLDFSNKYGDIKMSAYHGDEVKITITIRLEGKGSKAAEQLQNIEVNFTHEANRLNVETIVPNSNYQNLQIDWDVKFPVSNQLKIRNMYGDLHLNESNAKTHLDVSYGNLILGSLNSNQNWIKLQYGKGSLAFAEQLELILRYSEMNEIKQVNQLNIDAMYSETTMNTIGSLTLQSAYDEHEINHADIVKINAMYSDIFMSSISRKLTCESMYGDLRVNKISKQFESVNYSGSYGDAKLGFEAGANIELDAHTSYGDLYLPNGEWHKVENATSTSVNGSTGNPGKPVSINISFGDVKITIVS